MIVGVAAGKGVSGAGGGSGAEHQPAAIEVIYIDDGEEKTFCVGSGDRRGTGARTS
jgi:hypothetical protein